MKLWIYDENSYPSGFAGGHVPDTTDKFFLCLKEENGIFTGITSSPDAEKGKTGQYFLFSKTFYEKSDWYGGFSYVDLILP